MSRKQKHEEHANHEAWAIPYGDLITLLLAFFVVMYAVSSVNEGKYRVLSDALQAAFRGNNRAIDPIQVGEVRKGPEPRLVPSVINLPISEPPTHIMGGINGEGAGSTMSTHLEGQHDAPGGKGLGQLAGEIEAAMADLISDDLVSVRRMQSWLEVEIRTDVLFPSASAGLVSEAVPIMTKLAHTLQPFANPVRIEGYTDDLPISSDRFPSNWELSAARAASVARLFTSLHIDPKRLTVTGYGEFRPIADNKTAEGRDKNRRVVLVVLAAPPKGNISPNSMGENMQQTVPVAPMPAPIKTTLPINPLGD